MSTVSNRQHPVNVRTPAGDAFSGLAYRVLRLAGLLTAAGDALAKPAGQTAARWQVLAAVEVEPASVAAVARALGLARQSVQRVADALETGGLVAFEDNPRHRRARLMRLTPRGRAALDVIQARQAPWADALGARVGGAKLDRANRVLDEVFASLADAAEREAR
jgi:DNA-binding MarR family transcriptional regulator